VHKTKESWGYSSSVEKEEGGRLSSGRVSRQDPPLLSHSENREGRVAVSVPDLRCSNRLRWRRYANFGGTRLWIGRPSGHGVACLLIVRKDGKVQKQMRRFGTSTRELLSLRDWLLSEDCTDVAMESTGVY
jgi:hypothetical protein